LKQDRILEKSRHRQQNATDFFDSIDQCDGKDLDAGPSAHNCKPSSRLARTAKIDAAFAKMARAPRRAVR
jgi:hypothetical protein